MDSIKVGEYVRTVDGIIRKIVRIERDNYNNYDCYITDKAKRLYIEDILKHSKNLIDLIEIGDFVNGVEATPIHYEKGKYDFIRNIETILTREQYEQNCYKVGEN